MYTVVQYLTDRLNSFILFGTNIHTLHYIFSIPTFPCLVSTHCSLLWLCWLSLVGCIATALRVNRNINTAFRMRRLVTDGRWCVSMTRTCLASCSASGGSCRDVEVLWWGGDDDPCKSHNWMVHYLMGQYTQVHFGTVLTITPKILRSVNAKLSN